MKHTLCALAAALLHCWPASAAAQTIVGRVLDDGTSLPVAHAVVEVLRADSSVMGRATSDATGRFVLSVRPGSYLVSAHAIGYGAGSVDLHLAAGDTTRIELRMSQSAVRLAPLIAEGVQRPRHSQERLNILERRKKAGFGVVMDQHEIRRRAPLELEDLFKDVPGMIRHDGTWLINGTFGPCAPTVFVDGRRIGDVAAFAMPGSVIAALEIHRRSSQVPAEYMSVGVPCGVVAIWTWAYLGDASPSIMRR